MRKDQYPCGYWSYCSGRRPAQGRPCPYFFAAFLAAAFLAAAFLAGAFLAAAFFTGALAAVAAFAAGLALAETDGAFAAAIGMDLVLPRRASRISVKRTSSFVGSDGAAGAAVFLSFRL